MAEIVWGNMGVVWMFIGAAISLLGATLGRYLAKRLDE